MTLAAAAHGQMSNSISVLVVALGVCRHSSVRARLRGALCKRAGRGWAALTGTEAGRYDIESLPRVLDSDVWGVL